MPTADTSFSPVRRGLYVAATALIVLAPPAAHLLRTAKTARPAPAVPSQPADGPAAGAPVETVPPASTVLADEPVDEVPWNPSTF